MARTKKARRIQMLVFGGVLLSGAAALVGFMAQDAIAFFKSPTELVAESWRPDQLLRVGGLVVEGTSTDQGPTHRFDVTDGGSTVTVSFTGVLPDLFREGQGVVAQGYWRGGIFEATEVLAKHDENYMPREVADALKEQGYWEADAAGASAAPVSN
ncbi:MAG TPA: cytochrome c maturation protein CcmE [Paracoccaceae bacterium]|nr:cytochrome c maturation protein CcmE [Paracoccaceae bacterium]